MRKSPEEIKAHFEKFAKEHGLGIFPTGNTDSLPSLIYSKLHSLDKDGFENNLLKSGAPFIIMSTEDVKLELEMYLTDPDWFEENDENYKSNLKFLKSKADEILSVEVGYVYQGFYFFQYNAADWDEQFEEIQDICMEYDGDFGEDDGTDDIDLGGLLN